MSYDIEKIAEKKKPARGGALCSPLIGRELALKD
jgi:hypothetical protein